MALDIRALTPAERPLWEPLWQGYLTFYKAVIPSATTDETWRRLNDPAEPMHLRGAFDGDTLLGIVHFIEHRSTWTTGNYVYLQDLFTVEAARGQGVARALIARVCEEAKAAGASRVHWLTHEDNATARALYDKVADRPGFIQYRTVF